MNTQRYKFLAVTLIFSLGLIGCQNAQPTAQTNTNPTTATPASPKKDDLTARSHSTDNQKPPMSQSNSGGSPMQKAVDVTELTANIEKAEKDYKAKPNDKQAKETLAAAYFERAFVLTKAAQYRAAIGDFRKGLKLKPDDQEAKAMYDQTIAIFKQIGREPPKEGEEPTPLPVEKPK